jgi:hypothetical protein
VFAVLVDTLGDMMVHPPREPLGAHEDDVMAVIEASNRAYLLAYRDNARLMSVFEQVAQVDPDFREMRRARGIAFAERQARAIRRLQEEGRADPELDAFYAALAVGGMVGRMAYQVFVLEVPVPFEQVVETVTRLWVNALGITQAPRSA